MDSAPNYDFDGDGKTDISIFRPSNSEWWYLRSSDGANAAFQFGNSSDRLVRIPGNLKGHGVVVHPSPKLAAAVGWRSPVDAAVRIEAAVTHAHIGCGNGVAWSLELRRGGSRQRLAEGIAESDQPVVVGPIEKVAVQPGDLVSLVIGPRGEDHSCDLTDLEFTLRTLGETPQEWSLTRDVSGSVLAGNPHADSAGRELDLERITSSRNAA